MWDADSGAEIGMLVWQCRTFKAPTAVHWMEQTSSKGHRVEHLAWGSQTGYIIVWKLKNPAEAKDPEQQGLTFQEHSKQHVGSTEHTILEEITSIASSLSSEGYFQLLASSAGHVWKVFVVNTVMLFLKSEVRIEGQVPRAVAFLSNSRDILVFSMFEGVLYVFSMHQKVLSLQLSRLWVNPTEKRFAAKVKLDCDFV